MYFTYIIECNDKTLYTGICTDPQKRLDTHKKKNQLSAKYTRSHGADRILALWMSDDRSKAQKLEYRIILIFQIL